MGQARCVRLRHFFLLFANSQCRITAGPAHALPLTSPLFSAPHSIICLSAKRHLTSTIDHLPFKPGYHPLLLFDLCAVHPLLQYSLPHMPLALTTPCDVTLAGFRFTINVSRLNEHNDKPVSASSVTTCSTRQTHRIQPAPHALLARLCKDPMSPVHAA